MRRNLQWIFITFLAALVIFIVMSLLFQVAKVEGSSMEESFYDGQYIVVNKMLYHFRSPERGDVIIFHPPVAPNSVYIKRIVGEPGDHVEICEGKIYINGELLEEPDYVSSPSYTGKWNVPQDYYFVLGDNRNYSQDSHTWGFVSSDNIVGEVWLCYWPPSEWGLSPNYDTA